MQRTKYYPKNVALWTHEKTDGRTKNSDVTHEKLEIPSVTHELHVSQYGRIVEPGYIPLVIDEIFNDQKSKIHNPPLTAADLSIFVLQVSDLSKCIFVLAVL